MKRSSVETRSARRARLEGEVPAQVQIDAPELPREPEPEQEPDFVPVTEVQITQENNGNSVNINIQLPNACYMCLDKITPKNCVKFYGVHVHHDFPDIDEILGANAGDALVSIDILRQNPKGSRMICCSCMARYIESLTRTKVKMPSIVDRSYNDFHMVCPLCDDSYNMIRFGNLKFANRNLKSSATKSVKQLIQKFSKFEVHCPAPVCIYSEQRSNYQRSIKCPDHGYSCLLCYSTGIQPGSHDCTGVPNDLYSYGRDHAFNGNHPVRRCPRCTALCVLGEGCNDVTCGSCYTRFHMVMDGIPVKLKRQVTKFSNVQ